MKLPITIDPRYHDAVLFDLDGALTNDVPLFGATVDLARKLRGIGVAAAAYSSSPQCQQALKAAGIDDLFGVCIDGIAGERGTAEKPDPAVLLEAARRLGVRPQRCVVVENSDAGVAAGRDGGFALVIGIDRHRTCRRTWRAAVPTSCSPTWPTSPFARGDKRISELPNALASYGQLIGITERPRVDGVPRLRRNAVPHRLRSRCGQRSSTAPPRRWNSSRRCVPWPS